MGRRRKTITITADDDWLVVEGLRIVGYTNNRDGMRRYRRDAARGKGFLKIPLREDREGG